MASRCFSTFCGNCETWSLWCLARDGLFFKGKLPSGHFFEEGCDDDTNQRGKCVERSESEVIVGGVVDCDIGDPY